VKTLKQFILPTLIFLVFAFKTSAQNNAPVNHVVPLAGVVDLVNVKSNFNPVLQSTEIEDGSGRDSSASPFVKINHPSEFFREDISDNAVQFKTFSAEMPIIVSQFNGANDNQYTPPDNTLAISKAGIIFSAMNSSYRLYAPTSGNQTKYISFFDALKNTLPALTGIYYDPKVIYDAENDRFIVIVLNGNTSASSSIVILFSKSGDPADGWYTYDLKGDIFSNGQFSDYPQIGLSKSDLFVTVNLFNNSDIATGPAVLQLNKSDGYNGKGINFLSYDVPHITGLTAGYTLTPAPHGLGGDYGDSMYLVANNRGGGNSVSLLKISGSEISGKANLVLNATIPYPSLYCTVPSPSKELQVSTNFSLSAGDVRITQAFYLDNKIHYVFATRDQFTGYTDMVYCRLNIAAKTVVHVDLGLNNYDYVYPSIASMGQNDTDRSVLIGYCKGGSGIYPEVDVVQCDRDFNFSPSVIITPGTSSVTGSNSVLRWGDYTGMVRQYGTNNCFFAGSYGSGNSYQTTIAQIGLSKNTSISEGNLLNKSLSVFPNPSSNIFRMTFNLEERAHLLISVNDMIGKRVETLYEGTSNAGTQIFSFNKGALVSGTYFLLIKTDKGQKLSRKIVIE